MTIAARNEAAATPLLALHRALHAKMTVFAGVQLPVHYPPGIIKEHLHAREQAALFDVSHMGQIELRGRDAAAVLESVTPGDFRGLRERHQRYTLFTNEAGGIEDDLMVANIGSGDAGDGAGDGTDTSTSDTFFIVVNATRKEHDLALLRAAADSHACTVTAMTDRALLALQGPRAAEVLATLAPEACELAFMQCMHVHIAGVPCFLSRSGYTGEDGFEISVPAEAAADIARRLLANEAVQAAGLGARDSLRLEAGLCLYGHDLDERTSPAEAGLKWAIAKTRRPGGARAGGFPGHAIILAQLQNGVSRMRVGIAPDGRAPVRDGAELLIPSAGGEAGQPCGRVTSGGYGPSLARPLSMGYVAIEHATIGTELQAIVRGKLLAVRVHALPFMPHRYHRG